MYDSECLLLDSNDHPSSCTQPSNSSISMSIDSSSQHYTRESIMLALKYKPKEYTTVKKKSKAKCWSKFGLPAKIIGPGKFEIIKNFASCTSCFQTYSYSSSTTTISNHKCLVSSNENQSKIELIPLVKSNTSTTYSDTTTSDRINSVNHKTLQKHKRLITSVISDWVWQLPPIASWWPADGPKGGNRMDV
ncbi:unnamed protein product [Rotaria magnacalcarata]|uniref:Uncharacterized protein n=1 Tax=Rotaria magnacalcarata TaxID=392030 RepID=A0A819D5F7_9BILA|nr:unnamed protein product [Rotaria magnacalcarata]